jgi:hypothetical protein
MHLTAGLPEIGAIFAAMVLSYIRFKNGNRIGKNKCWCAVMMPFNCSWFLLRGKVEGFMAQAVCVGVSKKVESMMQGLLLA